MSPIPGIVVYCDAGVQGTRFLWTSSNIPPIYKGEIKELTDRVYKYNQTEDREELIRYWTDVVNSRRHLLPPELDLVELIRQLSRGSPTHTGYPRKHCWYREEPDTLPESQRGKNIAKVEGLFHPLQEWLGDTESDKLTVPRHASWLSAQLEHDLPPPLLPTAMDIWVMYFLGDVTPHVNHNKERKVVHCCFSGGKLRLIMSCRLQFLVPAMALPTTPIDRFFWHGHADYIGPAPPAAMPRYGKILDPNRVRSWRTDRRQRKRQGGEPAQQAQAGPSNALLPGQQVDGLQNFDYFVVDPNLVGHNEQYESFPDFDDIQDPIWSTDMNSLSQPGPSNASAGPSSGPADLSFSFSFSDSANMTQQEQQQEQPEFQLVMDTDIDVDTDPWAPFYVNDDGEDEIDKLFADAGIQMQDTDVQMQDADVQMQDDDEAARGALPAAVEMHADAAQHGNIGERVPGPDDPGFDEYVASMIREYLARSEQQD